MSSSSSRRFCMAIWLVLSSAAIALVGVFVGTLGALMNLSGINDTAALLHNDSVISSSSRLYGLYGDRLYAVLSPIDRNLNNRTDQIDFTLIFGRWYLDTLFIVLGWVLAACAIASILLPILRRRPSRHHSSTSSLSGGNACSANSCWLFCLGFCVTIYSFYDIALVILVIIYYAFRDEANLAAIDYMNSYAFGEKYAGDKASDYRMASPEIFSFTLLINFIQRTYSCCGFSSYRDYTGGAARLWTQQNIQQPPATLPLVCCADLSVNASITGATLDGCRMDISTGNYRAQNWNTIGCYRTLVADIGQRVAVGLTAGVSILVVVLSVAIASGSLLIDMERNRGRSPRRHGGRHHNTGSNHRQPLEYDNDWQLQQSPSSYSDDEEFSYPNKLYAHRF